MPEEQRPEPKPHRKIVALRFADLEVKIESDDEYSIAAINQLAIDDLALLLKDRIAYTRVFDDDQGDSGDILPEPKPLSAEKPEVRAMYQ